MPGAELNPSDHSKPAVRKVLVELVRDKKWVLREEGHWGRLYCPCGCTTIPVSGSPQNADNHARRIRRIAARCPLPPDDPRRSLAGMDR
jgi:hypothetical protein